MRKALKITGSVVQVVAVVAFLSAAAVLAVPRLLGWQTVTVVSGSMAPAYAVDAVLAIEPVSPTELRVGDVIAFQPEADRPMITHRVVAIERDAGGLTFVTQGDANEDPDTNPVAPATVRGRVVFGVPHLGLFVRAVSNPVGFGALVIVPGIVLLVLEVLSIRRERRARLPQLVATQDRDLGEFKREVCT
jgi:signal peptidase